MHFRRLGPNGPHVSALGLGCMGMSEFYGATDEAQSLATLDRALGIGVTFWDTADAYGRGANEELIGRALRGRRERVFLATKFGLVRGDDPAFRGISGRPAYVRSACEASLRRLNVDTIDLYYQHRVDATVPIEETVGAMAELVHAGKVRYLGLSEAAATTIRAAHAVHPIAALQSEYSLFSRDPEDNGVLATLRELGIGFVPYSPLGRGFLSGTIRSMDDLAADDFRRVSPRFAGANFATNLALVDEINALAAELHLTPAQLALAWVLAKGEHIVPIPGTKRVAFLDENAAATVVVLTPAQLARIEAAAPKGTVAGERYADMSAIGR